ncbi:MAG: hypothetical protein OEU26_16085 [Candidatus Tectomicrobia bacterium]|nr:hypothetical protein [Candidatus Tectomicrobia bacterium]
MEYPLNLSFKILALAPQISVTDARGNLVFYVKQKLMKLKESVTVFANAEQTEPLYYLNADQVIDFSARYHFADADGTTVGAVQRRGMKSLWRAHYDIVDGDRTVLHIREANPWVKVADALLGEIPVLGMLTGYLFHPAYIVTKAGGMTVMRLEKQRAFLETKFTLTKQQIDLTPHEETQVLLSLLMMVLLERQRG